MNKKKAQTLEGLLEEYQNNINFEMQVLPQNWIWVKLINTCDFIDYRGKTPRKTLSGVRLITAKNVRMNRVNLEPLEFIAEEEYSNWMTRGLPKQGDILITTEAPLGNVALLDTSEKVALAQRIITLVPNDTIDNHYLKFILQSPQIQSVLKSNSTGTTVSGIKASKLKEIKIPLPPLDEQNRIANKIKMLFEKIDEAKRLIEEAKETFELRRAAILDMAYRGGNTRSDAELPKGWGYKKFNEVANVKSNLVNPLDYLDYPHIAPDNIEKNTGKLLDYRTIGEDNVKSNKHYFGKGSILYSKIRPYLSKVVIADFEGLCSADMYPIETELENEYLYWYMLSPLFLEQATTAGSRSVLPKINQKELGEILVPVCSTAEQKNTIKFIKSVLDGESMILENLIDGLTELNRLSTSVLSKAFKGELGTNDSKDEPAIELLNSILQKKMS
ncbi:hypothetical protein GI482_02445 [Bacillus sp. N3536]|nr:hypothetical protein GI482_02445 [Bacillus sp. N3536]